MSVYVDDGRHPYGRLRMAHLIADSLEELHAMADRVGLERRWFQHEASFPHYDLCRAKRARALDAGAIPVDRRGLARALRRIRAAAASRGLTPFGLPLPVGELAPIDREHPLECAPGCAVAAGPEPTRRARFTATPDADPVSPP